MYVPGEVELYLAVVQVEQSVDEDGPLEHQAGHQEVDADRAQAVPLQERHQEAEADEYHHVHVLKHCSTGQAARLQNYLLTTR